MEKLKRSRLFNRLNSMSIRMSFVLYALFSLLIGIIICIFLISMVDRYRINLNYKYENMSTRYDIPENGSFTATYSNDQTKYTIFDLTRKETRYASSMLIIKKNAQYTNMSIRTMFHISKFYLILQAGIGLLTVL
jgi:hypothetical protein